ncbi:hypothetical protein Tco_0918116 [Tanacetum coccineum]
MHIRNDPSFFLTNKTGAPRGEELGLIKPLSDSSFSCSNKFETPLVESKEDLASPQEIHQERLELLARPQVASSSTCFQPPLQ